MKLIRKAIKTINGLKLIKYIMYGKENPFTMTSYLGSLEMAYKCPLCKSPIGFDIAIVDPVIGAQINCDQCDSIAHVPGAVRRVTLSREKEITTFNNIKISAGVTLPISKFANWYFAHPFTKATNSSDHADIHFHYGLWAFCNRCKHQYSHNILPSFALSSKTKGFLFNAHSSESKGDMESLMNGVCSDCGSKKMIVVLSEIPKYVFEHLSEIQQGKKAFSFNPENKKNYSEKKKVCIKCNNEMNIDSLQCSNCGSIKFIWE